MKVADLIEDLETGDRTMEHLAKPDPEEGARGLAAEFISAFDQMARSSPFNSGLAQTGAGLEALRNIGLNQQSNQWQAVQNYFGASTNAFGTTWR